MPLLLSAHRSVRSLYHSRDTVPCETCSDGAPSWMLFSGLEIPGVGIIDGGESTRGANGCSSHDQEADSAHVYSHERLREE